MLPLSWGPLEINCWISFAPVFSCMLSPCLSFISFLYLDSYVLGDDAWISKGSFMQTQSSLCLDSHQN